MPHLNESCHIWMSHVTYEWVMSRVAHMFECNMTCIYVHSYVCQSCRTFWKRNARLIHICDSFIFVTELMHLCDMTHTHMWHRCDMTHSHIWLDSFKCVTWVMSHLWMSHVTYVNESCHICEWVMSHIWLSLVVHMRMSHVTHMNESCQICE